MKIVRPDLYPTVAFLCTRVTKRDKDDRKKLRSILAWVKKTIKYKRVICASIIEDIPMWVNAAYNFHSDIKIQTV